MIVEFAGPSGGGKSVLHRIARQELRSLGIRCQIVTTFWGERLARRRWWKPLSRLMPSRWHRFAERMHHLYEIHPSVARFRRERTDLWQLVCESQKGRRLPWRHRLRVWQRFLRVAGGIEFVRRTVPSSEAILFSEGLAQRVAMLFTAENATAEAETVHRYLDLIPRPDLLIWVSCPFEMCLERSRKRKLPFRFRGKSDEEVERFARAQYDLFEDCRRYLRGKGWPILEIENLELADSQKQLRDGLTHFIEERQAS